MSISALPSCKPRDSLLWVATMDLLCLLTIIEVLRPGPDPPKEPWLLKLGLTLCLLTALFLVRVFGKAILAFTETAMMRVREAIGGNMPRIDIVERSFLAIPRLIRRMSLWLWILFASSGCLIWVDCVVSLDRLPSIAILSAGLIWLLQMLGIGLLSLRLLYHILRLSGAVRQLAPRAEIVRSFRSFFHRPPSDEQLRRYKCQQIPWFAIGVIAFTMLATAWLTTMYNLTARERNVMGLSIGFILFSWPLAKVAYKLERIACQSIDEGGGDP